ncbi:gag-pol polyprotein [Hordeum vulgare]|nr:gag-pol polyprotein [Hordeum vulgare]
MDRDDTSPSVYNHSDEFDAMKKTTNAKMDDRLEELKIFIKNRMRSSSSSRTCSSAHASELPSPRRSNRHRHHHRHEEMTMPTSGRPTTNKREGHLRRQSPHDKLPKLMSMTSMSYYKFINDYEIPFYGTHDPQEYLEWECKMDTYLKLLQVPYEDQVKCARRNFHDYVSTWWLHTSSKSFDMSWTKTKKGMRREFVPSTYMEHLQHQLKNTTQGSKSIDKYFITLRNPCDEQDWTTPFG